MEAPPLPIAVPNPNRFTETDHCSVYYLDLIDDRYWLTNIRTLLGPTPIRCPFTPLYFRAFLPLCTLADVPPSHPPSLLPHTLSKAEPRGGHPTPPQAYISLGATQSRTLQTPRNRTKTLGQSPSTAFPASPHTLQSMSGSPSYRYAPLADSEWTTWDRQLPNPARVLLELDLDFGIVPPTGGQGEKVGRVGGRWVRRERWRKASSSHPPFHFPSTSSHARTQESTKLAAGFWSLYYTDDGLSDLWGTKDGEEDPTRYDITDFLKGDVYESEMGEMVIMYPNGTRQRVSDEMVLDDVVTHISE